MKTLTKIKLINWHGFYDNEIDINGSTLITAENGSGKSSLIDALYFVLSGGDTDNFNAASGDEKGRTLETYMRGRTGTVGKEFIRDGDIITHIALEFYDTDRSKYFVVGVVLELIEGRKNKITSDFYHIINKRIADEFYFDCEDGQITYLDKTAMFKKVGDGINPLPGKTERVTQKSIRTALYSILSLDGDNYYELLHKAVAFKPITDVSDFVYKFLMPQKNIDSNKLKDNIRVLNELQLKIDIDSKKKARLESIRDYGYNYRNLLIEQKLLEAYRIKKSLKECQKTIDQLNSVIAENKANLKTANFNIENYVKKIESLQKTIWELTHSEAYAALAAIKSELEQEQRNNKELKIAVEKVNGDILKEQKICEIFKFEVNLQKFIKTKDYGSFIKVVQAYIEILVKEKAALEELIAKLKLQLEELEALIKNLNNDKLQLEQGINPYPTNVNTLIHIIKEGLKTEQNKNIEVVPFCELIEINPENEVWRNALEGYLNSRKFDLFVSQQYYDEALKIYESYKKVNNVYGVGLVNVAKLNHLEILPNALATKLSSTDERAQKYISEILGKIVCVESECELKNFERSITKTVMVYQNKAARKTDPRFYAKPYIGVNAIKLRLEAINKELNEKKDERLRLSEERNKAESLLRIARGSNATKLFEIDNVWELYDESRTNLQQLQARRAEIERNNNLYARVNTQEALLKEAKDKKNGEEDVKSKCEREISQAESKLLDNKLNMDSLNEAFSDALRDSDVYGQIENFCETHNYTNVEVKKKLDEDKKHCEDLIIKIRSLMQDYIKDYEFDAVAEIDSLDAFLFEFNTVVNRDLTQYNVQLEIAKQKAIECFQNSYIADIRKRIRDEKTNINNLNRILADKPFGVNEERYHFEVSKSQEKSFADLYDIFISNENYETHDLFTEQLSDKSYALMEEVFKRLIADPTDNKQAELIKKYTDYRSFMSYDIKITNKKDEVSYLSQNLSGNSTGEKQTAFYVIMAASFDKIIHGGYGQKSSVGIVIFDEAFNNMDGSRIDSMLRYFDELNIQPIISVPELRSKEIMPYVSTTIGLVKQEGCIFSRQAIKVK